MTGYARPLVQHRAARPEGALTIAGGNCWFTHAQILTRGAEPRLVRASDLDPALCDRLTAPRAPIAGLDLTRPRLMGILNVTPDSFSDGGMHHDVRPATEAAGRMAIAGADIIDIGGESTRPGATEVPAEIEISRTSPVIAALADGPDLPLSIDTRKAAVAGAALAAGARMVNDVSGFTFDDGLAPLCAEAGVPVCVMHAQGDPATMQQDPAYGDVLLDVYDFLDDRIDALVSVGVARDKIIVDPGIGFGKSREHNLTILRNISLFHGLGCAILLGVSRKGFIGAIGGAEEPRDRMPGSVAVGLAAVAQGVQILRVHDVGETAQALRLWSAVR